MNWQSSTFIISIVSQRKWVNRWSCHRVIDCYMLRQTYCTSLHYVMKNLFFHMSLILPLSVVDLELMNKTWIGSDTWYIHKTLIIITIKFDWLVCVWILWLWEFNWYICFVQSMYHISLGLGYKSIIATFIFFIPSPGLRLYIKLTFEQSDRIFHFHSDVVYHSWSCYK